MLTRICANGVTGRMIALASILCLVYISAIASPVTGINVEPQQNAVENDIQPRKLELNSGFYVEVPRSRNATEKLLSFGFEPTKDVVEGRGKQKKLMQRILPMFIMPFLIQSAIIPMFLGMLKFMLFKSLMVGKLALSLIILNAFKNHNSVKGRNDAVMADVHYGYHGNGMEEVGTYVN